MKDCLERMVEWFDETDNYNLECGSQIVTGCGRTCDPIRIPSFKEKKDKEIDRVCPATIERFRLKGYKALIAKQAIRDLEQQWDAKKEVEIIKSICIKRVLMMNNSQIMVYDSLCRAVALNHYDKSSYCVLLNYVAELVKEKGNYHNEQYRLDLIHALDNANLSLIVTEMASIIIGPTPFFTFHPYVQNQAAINNPA